MVGKEIQDKAEALTVKPGSDFGELLGLANIASSS